MTPVDVICFDIGGTLLDSGPSFAAAVQRLAGRRLHQYEWDLYINLARGPAETDLVRLCDGLKLARDEIAQLYQTLRARRPRLFDEVLPTLAALSHVRCVALSNAAAWLIAPHLCGAERYLSDVFYSHTIGHAKPDPAAFHYLQRRVGVAADRILMVGDSFAYDYAAAREAGWRALLLDRAGTALNGDEVERADTIPSLSALLDVVASGRGSGDGQPSPGTESPA